MKRYAMKRLVDPAGEASAFERELLASASADRMSPGARAAVVTAATAGGGAMAAGVATTALRVTKAWSLLGTKWGIVGLAATMAAVGTASVVVAGRAARPQASAVDALATPALAGRREATAAPLPIDAPVVITSPPPALAGPSRAPAPAQAASHSPAALSTQASPPARGAPTLGEQARLIESARLALRQGNAAQALARLDEFDRRFPGDALAEEASVTRIEAFAAADPGAARALGNAYLAAHPDGAYARHVTRLLARLDAAGAAP